MSDRVSRAVTHLNSILPLAKNYRALNADAVRVHNFILHTYVNTGRAPLADELSRLCDNVAGMLRHLQASDLIVLDEHGAIRGAYPFTSEARVHRAVTGNHTIHCMCALDVLAISPVFKQPTEVHSQCMLSSEPLIIVQEGYRVLSQEPSGDIFLAIDWGAACATNSCADSLCGQMNFIIGATLATAWQLQNDQHDIFTLTEAIEFADRFFNPLTAELQAA
jgi:hypothetical protein